MGGRRRGIVTSPSSRAKLEALQQEMGGSSIQTVWAFKCCYQ